MATKKKLLQAAAGSAGGGEGLNVEQVFSTYLYEGQENRVVKSEITSSESRTDNHIAYSFTLANNLGADYTNTTESNLTTDADLSILSRSASSTVDNTTDRKLAMGLYSSSSEGKYYQSLYKNTSTVDSFSVAGTFPYGTATGVSVVEVRNGFNFSSSTSVQSGDLLLFVAVGKNSSYAAASGFTEIDAVTETGGTYGFMARIAAKIADGTENGTDFGDNFLLSTSGSEYGILLRKTGGSWDISGAASGAALTSTNDVVSTLITNDIDLDGEGGLVWIKNRDDGTADHSLWDTERGALKYLKSNATDAETDLTSFSTGVTSFNSNGFTLGGGDKRFNKSANDFASWTFRKAPKFFDVVTYTGTGNENNTINHNLGSVPGMIIVKRTDSTSEWLVYHRGVNGGTNPEQYNLRLQGTDAQDQNSSYFSNTAPTSTTFTVGSLNSASGGSYVAYLFAHNDGDGTFGPTGDQDIIKCGTFNGAAGTRVELGFEPQFIIHKTYDTANSWGIQDVMRGMPVGSSDQYLLANSSAAEANGGLYDIDATGFTWKASASGSNYIYIAIRRGPMAVPTDATDVFAVDNTQVTTEPNFTSNFPVDFAFMKTTSGSNTNVMTRLMQGTLLRANLTDAEVTNALATFDYMDGHASWTNDPGRVSHMWRRAPSFCDVVAYTGNGTAGRTVSHNLGVAPEMMWVKGRDVVDEWHIYHSGIDRDGDGLPETDYTIFSTAPPADSVTIWNDTAPTDSVFTLGNNGGVNGSGSNYVAYLFASLDGVSKVGSFTAGSTDTFVDCGFSSSARFVLMKRSSGIGDWFVYDSERGYVAGTGDKRLKLNTTDAETTNNNIDPTAGGFTVTGNTIDAGDYIFYAIA